MSNQSLSFGDNVRVIATSDTEQLGLAGLVGQVYGHTTPSVTGVEVIGEVTDDFAINVRIEDRDTDFWFNPELLEFVDHAPGTEVRFDGAATKWTRNADGGWDESPTTE